MKFILIVTIINTLISQGNSLATLIKQQNFIPNSYIVSLKKDSKESIESHIKKINGLISGRSNSNKIHKVFNKIGKVYHATLDTTSLNKVRNLTEVDFIEMDSKVSINSIQNNSPWGLARISQRQFINKNTYNYNGDGYGVTVYVIDSGIQINHPEFEGRAVFGANFMDSESNEDLNGHGTHCSGTVGSKTYGIAKNVNLVAVKVLDEEGNGSWSSIIAGINWVTNDKRGKYANVISLSITGGFSQSANNALDAATNNNIFSVVAAGNNNQDACSYSPASASTSFTIAASDINDTKASFSNYGSCVSLIAPGVNILSTWNNGGTNTMSGTSMATPHVAGLAAYFYSKNSYTIPQLKNYLVSISTKNIITGFDANTKNYLAYNSIS